ncbi:MAG: magnesium transporter [Ruminiclostridium sp.]|nr:magnesium transporter [Ruminiclostridium sp.]
MPMADRDRIIVTLGETLAALVEAKKYTTLRDILVTMNATDIAVIFEDLPKEKLPLLFRLLPKELAAETFVEMEPEAQELLIQGFSDNELKEVVNELYVDDAVDLVEEMPANVVKRILKQADPEMRKMINEILKYPEDSAGSIMTTEYVSLRPVMTAEEAIKRIRRTGVDKETIYTCYVTDNNRKLLGMVTLRTLLLAEEDDRVEDIMEDNVISVNTLEDQESVVQMMAKYDWAAIPVVDQEGRLVGIVTIDDAIDVLQEETTEDFELLAGMTPTDKPYLRTGVFETWKSRIPWLLILMLSATLTSMVLTGFESSLAACSVLIAFIPMLTGTGGNSGTQSSVAVIRALSLGEVEFSDTVRVIWKEIRVGVLCGVTLASCNFVKLLVVDKMILGNDGVTVLVAGVICLTMVLTVLCAKTVGCVLPLLAEKIHVDPAVMASPFISTVVDVTTLLLYFQVAKILLGI